MKKAKAKSNGKEGVGTEKDGIGRGEGGGGSGAPDSNHKKLLGAFAGEKINHVINGNGHWRMSLMRLYYRYTMFTGIYMLGPVERGILQFSCIVFFYFFVTYAWSFYKEMSGKWA